MNLKLIRKGCEYEVINEILHTFICVCRHGSFNQAGKVLGISTPAVMKQMNVLEKAIGTPLFIRTKQGVLLLPAGESFLSSAEYILQYTKEAVNRARQAAGYDGKPMPCHHSGKNSEGGVTMEHPKVKVPDTEEGRRRYASAKKHAKWVKDHGGSNDEIHAMFKKIMYTEGKKEE